jgi:hypothetical protein
MKSIILISVKITLISPSKADENSEGKSKSLREGIYIKKEHQLNITFQIRRMGQSISPEMMVPWVTQEHLIPPDNRYPNIAPIANI